MSKRKAESIIENINKKMKTESFVVTVEELNRCKYPNKVFNSIEEEIDEVNHWFDEAISSINEKMMTRSEYRLQVRHYCKVMKKMCDFNCRLTHLFRTNVFSHDFYLDKSSKLIQKVLSSTRTPIGLMIQENHPKFKDVVIKRFNDFSTLVLKNGNNHHQVNELRHFANTMSNQVFV